MSTSPLFPNLAGQQEIYLAAQLKAFKAKTRGEPDAHDYMWGMATLLDDSVIEGLAVTTRRRSQRRVSREIAS